MFQGHFKFLPFFWDDFQHNLELRDKNDMEAISWLVVNEPRDPSWPFNPRFGCPDASATSLTDIQASLLINN